MTRALLILPVPLLPIKRDALWKQYRSPIEHTLKSLSSDSTSLTKLDIALVLNGGTDTQRHSLFATFQTLFAEVYTLVCSLASQLKIDLDFNGGIDVCCIAVHVPFHSTVEQSQQNYAGPLTNMAAFLSSRGPYDKSFFLDSPEDIAARLPETFQQLASSSKSQTMDAQSTDPLSMNQPTISQAALDGSKSKIHMRVAVGGTFDHLHIGHKLLLTATVLIAQPGSQDREITVGITGDELLVNKKHADMLESWDVRQERCATFIESILVFDSNVSLYREIVHVNEPGPNGKVVKIIYSPPSSGRVTINYTQISDPFGPTITDESITALVISGETRAGGKAVNDKRVQKGWHALEVFEVDVLDAGATDTSQEDSSSTKASFNSKISSTEIRRRLATAE